jgi:hypothetical protein
VRRAARVDANQRAVVEALRAMGATVQLLHAVGKGCPDLLVGFAGRNVLLEVKDGNKRPSARALTPDEERFAATWRGQAAVVLGPAEAIDFVRRATA